MPQAPNNVKFGVPLMFVSFVVFAIALWAGVQLIDSEGAAAEDGAVVVDGGGGGGGGPVTVSVAAQNLLFDKRSLSASAGASFTVTLANRDPGVLHNIAFYTSRAATQLVTPTAKTDLVAGVSQQTLTFTPPRAGSFFFRCDVHPDVMSGSFVVR
jgi:plastocyanin